MASRSSLTEDLTCPVCREIFSDPVILTCSHSFCKTCLHDCWKDKDSTDCPLCRTRFTLAEIPCNLALKNLCETFSDMRSQRASAGSEVLCSLHSEKLKLFCWEDQEYICLVCQNSRKHRSHTCVPVDEAAQDHKEELQTALNTLEEKLKDLKKVQLTYDHTADYIKTQTVNTERLIKVEFKKLHQFLQEEEEARISALREEDKKKSDKMKEKIEWMNREMASLSDTIKAVVDELRAKDISFLQNLKATKEKTQVTLPDPQLVSGVLIDVAKHLGNLTFRVWEKMKGMVKYTPVIFDPNTAHPCLSLSEDLTRVTCQNTWQQLPDNPERFMKYANALGSKGFSSGMHRWEVEVGDHPRWNMGVAEESLDRKGVAYATPKYGRWVLMQDSGAFEVDGGENLTLQRRPQSIRVQLDYDKGELSFYDCKDMTHIYTFKHRFAGTLFPYFAIGESDEGETSDIQTALTVMSSK
ncbi:zinc-binding protein A33-like [Osmerus mordax]|uniref:zinc-binding protein A33-like n=1 Tax=Osmerus mordax TaxID=8014 RepID=UPI00350F09EE